VLRRRLASDDPLHPALWIKKLARKTQNIGISDGHDPFVMLGELSQARAEDPRVEHVGQHRAAAFLPNCM